MRSCRAECTAPAVLEYSPCRTEHTAPSPYLVVDAVAVGVVAVHKQLPATKAGPQETNTVGSAVQRGVTHSGMSKSGQAACRATLPGWGRQLTAPLRTLPGVPACSELFSAMPSCAANSKLQTAAHRRPVPHSPLLLAVAQGIQVCHVINLLRNVLCIVGWQESRAGTSSGALPTVRRRGGRGYPRSPHICGVNASGLSMRQAPSLPYAPHPPLASKPTAQRTPHQAAVPAAGPLWVRQGQQARILIVVGCVQARHALGPAAMGRAMAAGAASRW